MSRGTGILTPQNFDFSKVLDGVAVQTILEVRSFHWDVPEEFFEACDCRIGIRPTRNNGYPRPIFFCKLDSLKQVFEFEVGSGHRVSEENPVARSL